MDLVTGGQTVDALSKVFFYDLGQSVGQGADALGTKTQLTTTANAGKLAEHVLEALRGQYRRRKAQYV